MVSHRIFTMQILNIFLNIGFNTQCLPEFGLLETTRLLLADLPAHFL